MGNQHQPRPSRKAQSSTSAAEQKAFGWEMSLLFGCLLFVFVYLPIDVELPVSLFAAMFSGMLLAATFAVRANPRWLRISIGLAALAVVLSWAVTLDATAPTWLELAAFGSAAVYMIFTMAIIIVQLWQVQVVSAHTITAALSLYLLLGILGGLLFALLETAAPGSMTTVNGNALKHIEHTVDLFPPLLYFSFTTLTTVGFGDIYPVSAAARALTILEAVAGQVYLVGMVAVIVSMFASGRKQVEQPEVSERQRQAWVQAMDESGEAGLIERTEHLL